MLLMNRIIFFCFENTMSSRSYQYDQSLIMALPLNLLLALMMTLLSIVENTRYLIITFRFHTLAFKIMC